MDKVPPWGWPGESLQLRMGLVVVFNQIYLSLSIRKKHLGVKKHKTERKWKIKRPKQTWESPMKWYGKLNKHAVFRGANMETRVGYFTIIKLTHKHPNRLKAIWESCTLTAGDRLGDTPWQLAAVHVSVTATIAPSAVRKSPKNFPLTLTKPLQKWWNRIPQLSMIFSIYQILEL